MSDHPRNALGGAERQSLFIAQALSARGFDIHIITRSPTREPRTFPEGDITIHELAAMHRGIVRKLLGLRNLVVDIAPDLCYQRNAGVETGVVAQVCRGLKRPFVYGSSSIWDATRDLFVSSTPGTMDILFRPFYRYGVSRAAVIVAETSRIAELFKREFPATKVSHIPPAILSPTPIESKDEQMFVVSVTRLIWYKRPHLILDLAKALPAVRFVLAGYGPLQPEIERAAGGIPNLRFVGKVTPDEALKLIKRARICVNTSMVESFPNTLLESLVCGTPYVSFYDPDEIICRHGLGAHPRTLDEMIHAVDKFMSSDAEVNLIAALETHYAETFHNPSSIAGQYERLFREEIRKYALM